jgi:hypothetical protein
VTGTEFCQRSNAEKIMTYMDLSCMESKPGTLDGIERRRHKRFRVKEDCLVFIGKETGTIMDISRGGLSVHCIPWDNKSTLPNQLDIFFAQSRFYLPNLPVFLVDDAQFLPNSSFSSFQIKRLRIKFGSLSDEQQARLDEFITLNTVIEN